MKGMKKKIVSVSIASLLAMLSAEAPASGYKLEFQSPSVLADAGEAAVVEDAGTNWYNSAGLVYIPQQLALSVIDVYQQTQFTGTSFAPTLAGPTYYYVNSNASASAYPNTLLPAVHYALPFKDRYAFGISIVPAWGLMEDYGENSDVRYSLTKISTKTIDVSPSLAMRLNEQWSIGAGPDFHYFSIQNRVHVNTAPVTASDSISRYTANNWGRGWHAGLLFRLNEATRVGLNYRSKIVMNLTGDSDFVLTGIESYHTNLFKVSIPLPAVTTVSLYRDLTPKFALMGTVAYDQWKDIEYYYGQNLVQPTGLTNAVLTQNFHNTFDFSVGTHYKLTDLLMLRGSLKYEPTPTNNANRALSFPDGDKLGLNFGAHYQINKKLAVDMIYAHVFTRDPHINDVNPLTAAVSTGHTRTSIDLIGAQLLWNV